MPEPPAPFDAPWQAQLHALTVALHESGAFEWSEWTDALSAELKRADAAPDGSDYHERALTALTELLERKGLAAQDDVARIAEALREASAHAH